MGKRRKARECTLQILFSLEFDDSPFDKILDQYWENKKASKEIENYCRVLVKGVISHEKQINNLIQSVSEHWRISRMAVIDRNVLRIAVFELLYEENLAPAIVINEALEIAKKYSSEESATFVNGILDAISKKSDKKKKLLKEDEHG
ncbi:transcription antitermination factor NusB [Acidobacteriota bacterium]